jgi:acyl-CoA synthetase (AMP-forming)/AMP-acid ligase II
MSVNLDEDIAETLDSVGTPLPGVRFSIVDEKDRALGAEETGQILVSSPGAITGYDDPPEANTSAFRNGYFYTGDLGRLDAQGRLYLLGRLKFMINKGGFKIDPREVEEVLEEHPGVEEVAVVGLWR